MKIKNGLTVLAFGLLAGCAGQSVNQSPSVTAPGGIVNQIDDKHYFVAESDKDHPCSVPNIYYVDQVKGSRQIAVNWEIANGYTLQGDRRERLKNSIKNAEPGCPMPYRIESRNTNRTDKNKTTVEVRAFVLYWLEGDTIHLKAVQFGAESDGGVGAVMPSPRKFEFRDWDDLKPNADREDTEKGKPYRGPVAAPQVVYRIDENRYFEFVPRQAYSCSAGTIMYVDQKQGIRSRVEYWDGSEYSVENDLFIIDAANTRYLLAPWRNGLSGVFSSGGGARSWLSYSADGGRTWQYRAPTGWGGHAVYAIGDNAYLILDGDAWIADLSKLEIPGWDWQKNWTQFKLKERPLPTIGKQPVDSKFHCATNGDEWEG